MDDCRVVIVLEIFSGVRTFHERTGVGCGAVCAEIISSPHYRGGESSFLTLIERIYTTPSSLASHTQNKDMIGSLEPVSIKHGGLLIKCQIIGRSVLPIATRPTWKAVVAMGSKGGVPPSCDFFWGDWNIVNFPNLVLGAPTPQY